MYNYIINCCFPTHLTQARVTTIVMMMQMMNNTNAATMTPIISAKHEIIIQATMYYGSGTVVHTAIQ